MTTVGNVFTVNGSNPIVLAGIQTLNPLATATKAGVVLPDSAGSTAVDTLGHLIATSLINIQVPYAPVNKTICQRAGYDIQVMDYGATGYGTATPIGTTYGSTLGAIAAYSYTDCRGNTVTPFAWLTGDYNGGVVSIKKFAPAQDWSQTVQNTQYTSSGSTTLVVGPAPYVSTVLAGESVYDITANVSLGTVASVSGQTLTLSSGITQAIYGGDTIVIQKATTTTAATATTQCCLDGEQQLLHCGWSRYLGHY